MKIQGITMIIRSLMGGGAERVMSTMANHWASRGVNVTIVTSVPPEMDAYWLDSRVRRVCLDCSRTCISSHGFPWNISALRTCIKELRNQLVVSFMDRSNIPVILATRGLNVRVILAERIDPRTQHYSLVKRILMRLCYPRADAVTVLTENVRDEWGNLFMPPNKVHVIHNPVLPLDVNPERVPSWLPKKFLCCMGRLHPQKGFDMLLDILPDIFKRWPEYDLVILGEGESRQQLERQAATLGIDHRIFMPGFVNNPHSIVQRASLFIFPSRCEGFPNALVEAMALGLPVISFDCPSGPAYLVDHKKNGLLVPPNDTLELASAIEYMLNNPCMATTMGKNAMLIQKKCHLEHVMGMWTTLLEGIQGDSSSVCQRLETLPSTYSNSIE